MMQLVLTEPRQSLGDSSGPFAHGVDHLLERSVHDRSMASQSVPRQASKQTPEVKT
jgi:hypothetical protein